MQAGKLFDGSVTDKDIYKSLDKVYKVALAHAILYNDKKKKEQLALL